MAPRCQLPHHFRGQHWLEMLLGCLSSQHTRMLEDDMLSVPSHMLARQWLALTLCQQAPSTPTWLEIALPNFLLSHTKGSYPSQWNSGCFQLAPLGEAFWLLPQSEETSWIICDIVIFKKQQQLCIWYHPWFLVQSFQTLRISWVIGVREVSFLLHDQPLPTIPEFMPLSRLLEDGVGCLRNNHVIRWLEFSTSPLHLQGGERRCRLT